MNFTQVNKPFSHKNVFHELRGASTQKRLVIVIVVIYQSRIQNCGVCRKPFFPLAKNLAGNILKNETKLEFLSVFQGRLQTKQGEFPIPAVSREIETVE